MLSPPPPRWPAPFWPNRLPISDAWRPSRRQNARSRPWKWFGNSLPLRKQFLSFPTFFQLAPLRQESEHWQTELACTTDEMSSTTLEPTDGISPEPFPTESSSPSPPPAPAQSWDVLSLLAQAGELCHGDRPPALDELIWTKVGSENIQKLKSAFPFVLALRPGGRFCSQQRLPQ
jgi:hypothetical protein